jgi:hypothetical protein
MNEDTKIALERFRNVLGYLQYENTVYWTRSGFLLTAEAALLGFSARVVPTDTAIASWPALVLGLGLCAVGLILCWLGLRMIRNSLHWIDRWIQLLTVIEPTAYGEELKVFRGLEASSAPTPSHFARDTAKYLIYVFVLAWLAIAGYLLFLAATK